MSAFTTVLCDYCGVRQLDQAYETRKWHTLWHEARTKRIDFCSKACERKYIKYQEGKGLPPSQQSRSKHE